MLHPLRRKQWADTAFWRTQIWWTTCRSCRSWWVEPPTLWQTWPLMAPCALESLKESLGMPVILDILVDVKRLVTVVRPEKSRSSDFMCATVKTCQDIIYWVLCNHLTVIRLVVGRLPPISWGMTMPFCWRAHVFPEGSLCHQPWRLKLDGVVR